MADRGEVKQSTPPDRPIEEAMGLSESTAQGPRNPNCACEGAVDARRRWRFAVHAHAVSVLICLIRCYQGVLRPLLVGSCKFYPTCSEYTTEALLTHGLWRGALLAVRRLLRCHPFGLGGYDPVPPPDPPRTG